MEESHANEINLKHSFTTEARKAEALQVEDAEIHAHVKTCVDLFAASVV